MRPVDSKYAVTLGYREKASFDPNYIHRGIDYGCPAGTVVRAAKAGQVVFAGRGGMGTAFGIHVVVKTSGIYHIYAHLSSESVFSGQGVQEGQILGRSGATGNVTGAHLHYGEFTSYWYTADRRPQFVSDETQAKPAKIRIATCNLPDEDKLPNTPARIARAVELLKAANLGIIGGNEWVGRVKAGVPSAHAKAIFDGLGLANGKLIIPTTAYNENYIILDLSKVSLVKQYPDKILPSDAGGRHLTPIVVKHLNTGRLAVYGQTHLVQGKDNGEARTLQGQTAMNELKRISKLHGDAPILVGGDWNRSDPLPAMTTAGLVKASKAPKDSTGLNYATFTTYKNVTPSKNLEQQFDEVYVPKGATVNGWTNTLDAPGGRFAQPRYSDHSIVVVSVTI